MNPQNLQSDRDDPPSSLARADIIGNIGEHSSRSATAPHKAAAVVSDHVPQAPRLGSISLLHIPPELATRILLYLSPHDIISCGRTCRVLHDLCNCPVLRYVVQMERYGVSDDMRPGLGYTERLRVLENREEAWATLDFRKTLKISATSDSTTLYGFAGGTLFLGKSLDPGRVPVGYSCLTLPSLSDAEGENLEWRWCNLETRILDVGHAVYEHDLIVALTGKKDVRDPRYAILELRLMRFSTGQPHPLAEQPIVFISKKALPIDLWFAQIQIVGDFLSLLMTCPGWSGNQEMFFLVRWKSGLVHHLASPRWGTYRDFVHLSQDTLVILNLIENTFEVAKIVIDSDDTPRLVRLCVLHLPPLTRKAVLEDLICRAEPNITGSGPFAIPSPSNRPFRDKAKEAIIIFHMLYRNIESWSRPRWHTLIVQRRALLAHIPAIHRASMPFCSCPEPAPPLMHVPWHAWGPSATRWSLNNSIMPTSPVTMTAGQRVVTLKDRAPSRIIVQDFNPYAVRAARALAAVSGQSQEGNSRKLPNGNQTTLKVEGSVLGGGPIFKEDVWSFLPYVETVTQREYDYDYVMIDGERILGLKALQLSEFGSSSFDVHILG